MDNDERDYDLVIEMVMERKRNKAIRERLGVWDEPYYEEEMICPRCKEKRYAEKPSGCRDFYCP